jgi:hypothetical protein
LLASRTAARDTVSSPTLNGEPSPEIRPRIISSPLSACRAFSCAGSSPSAAIRVAISAVSLSASTAMAARRTA